AGCHGHPRRSRPKRAEARVAADALDARHMKKHIIWMRRTLPARFTAGFDEGLRKDVHVGNGHYDLAASRQYAMLCHQLRGKASIRGMLEQLADTMRAFLLVSIL